MSSDLAFSARLGRQIRSGDAVALGTPTRQLTVEAFRRGDVPAAREYLDYQMAEARRVLAIFAVWLEHLLAYGERHVPDWEAHVTRLAGRLCGDPPRTEAAALLVSEEARVERALEADVEDGLMRALEELHDAQLAAHDCRADWCWGLLTALRDALGEDAMDDVFRVTQEPWVTERYAALATLAPHEIVELTIEGMRGHLSGPDRQGRIGVTEDDVKWVLAFDPCGSGGKMRRGDPVRGEGARTDAPFSFAETERAHDWSWGRAGVCLYCAHCAVVNEILPIERLGTPMRVTDYPASPDEPCRWTIYKRPEFVPDEAYLRVGKKRRLQE